MATTKPNKPKRRGNRLLGAYVPVELLVAINTWLTRQHEGTISGFIRAAAREKLEREGIKLT